MNKLIMKFNHADMNFSIIRITSSERELKKFIEDKTEKFLAFRFFFPMRVQYLVKSKDPRVD